MRGRTGRRERPARAATRGFLARLARGSPSRKRAERPLRQLLGRIGQGFAVALMAGVVGLALYAMFRPRPAGTTHEGDFPIEAIEEAAGAAPGQEATLRLHIQNQKVELPVSAEKRESLRPGRMVHVRYTYFPRFRRVRVDSWEPLPP